MTIRITLINKDLPSIKGAAKELGIDLFVEETREGESDLTVLITDYSQLVYLGLIAGINAAFGKMKEPLTQAFIDLESKFFKFKRENDV